MPKIKREKKKKEKKGGKIYREIKSKFNEIPNSVIHIRQKKIVLTNQSFFKKKK